MPIILPGATPESALTKAEQIINRAYSLLGIKDPGQATDPNGVWASTAEAALRWPWRHMFRLKMYRVDAMNDDRQPPRSVPIFFWEALCLKGFSKCKLSSQPRLGKQRRLPW